MQICSLGAAGRVERPSLGLFTADRLAVVRERFGGHQPLAGGVRVAVRRLEPLRGLATCGTRAGPGALQRVDRAQAALDTRQPRGITGTVQGLRDLFPGASRLRDLAAEVRASAELLQESDSSRLVLALWPDLERRPTGRGCVPVGVHFAGTASGLDEQWARSFALAARQPVLGNHVRVAAPGREVARDLTVELAPPGPMDILVDRLAHEIVAEGRDAVLLFHEQTAVEHLQEAIVTLQPSHELEVDTHPRNRSKLERRPCSVGETVDAQAQRVAQRLRQGQA